MQSPAPELKSYMVRAGAGAGKTYGLVERVVEVYQTFRKSGQIPRIVLTTFTRKATQELKERLVLRACNAQDAGLLQFVSDPMRLHISTIHGLLNVFLKQVGHLSEIDSGFQIADEGEADGLARRALRDTLLNHPEGLKWFETYGFERTLVMMRRFDAAEREGEPLSPATTEDLAAMAGEQRDLWRAKLAELAAGILEEVDNDKWREYAFTLERFVAAWPGFGTEGLPTKPRRNPKKPEFEDWHQRIDELLPEFREEFRKDAWDERQWPKMAEMWREFHAAASEFSRKYFELKMQHSRFEMADLELLSLKILREKPFLGAVFAENWDYWMIDEYQDTSPVQVQLLEALMAGQKRYLVGDPQQSIYLFRGADMNVFAEAEAEMKVAGAQIEHRRRNYRSEPDLLHFINAFTSSVAPDFASMQTRDLENLPNRDVCVMMRAPTKDDELRAVVSRVSELVRDGVELQNICILGRTHQNLLEVSRALKHFGYPTHVHASRGFTSRREVMDAQSLWAFLLNPHDNANLIALLRSPWFFVPDAKIEEWTAHKPDSLWRSVVERKTSHRVIDELKSALESVRKYGVLKTFEDVLTSACVLDLCLHNDPAGRKESNLWKLVMKARELESESTRSLLDLCERELSFDPMDASEGDANSAQEPNCINLMTVHGSKGLEFDHVIIPRMGEAQKLSTTDLFGHMDGKFFFPLWNEEDGRSIPSLLDMALARRQRERETKEFDRWLYVAVTRAKQTLTFTWSDRASGSWASRSTWFALEQGRHEEQMFTFAVREEWPDPEIFLPSRQHHPQVRPLFKEPGEHAVERQAVTDLVNAMSGAPLPKKEFLLSSYQARGAGQKIHRALENLKYNPEHFAETSDPAIEYVLGLKDPDMRQLIANGFVEWGFQVQTPRRIVEGQIDVWGKLNGILYIADYKSGSPSKMKQALEQLALYAWALRKFGHKEPIELLVIYPLAQKTVKQKFSEDLFRDWEVKFGLTEAAGENNLGAPLLDGGHGNVEGDLVGSAKAIHLRE